MQKSSAANADRKRDYRNDRKKVQDIGRQLQVPYTLTKVSVPDQQLLLVHESNSFAGISANGLLNAQPMVHKWSPHLHFETQPCKLAQWELAKQSFTCFAHLLSVHWQVGVQATVAQSGATGAASTFMMGCVSFSTTSISVPDQQLLLVHERSSF